jgi:hypothetical protein
MRATDIIRGLLDLIDQVDSNARPESCSDSENVAHIQTGVDTNRFKQIFDLLSSEYDQLYNNSPAEAVAGIESVTTNAGGGWNGPKNPADIRSDSVSIYPSYSHNPGKQ